MHKLYSSAAVELSQTTLECKNRLVGGKISPRHAINQVQIT